MSPISPILVFRSTRHLVLVFCCTSPPSISLEDRSQAVVVLNADPHLGQDSKAGANQYKLVTTKSPQVWPMASIPPTAIQVEPIHASF